MAKLLILLAILKMAERGGFEPPIRLLASLMLKNAVKH